MIRHLVVHAEVIELRHRQIHEVFPARASVLTGPKTAVIARENDIGVGRIDPDIVEIALVNAQV